jgi:hypothetical protein
MTGVIGLVMKDGQGAIKLFGGNHGSKFVREC